MKLIRKYEMLAVQAKASIWYTICNFFQKDRTNSKNRVSDSLESCTQDPKSNVFERISTYFDFIDTAGNNDSDEIDIIKLCSVSWK